MDKMMDKLPNKAAVVTNEEAEMLEQLGLQTGYMRNPDAYSNFDKESLTMFCRMKDRTTATFQMRLDNARQVIDHVARAVGINPEDTSYYLYSLDADGSSPITRALEGWISYRGDKAQLKRRVQELEQENQLLKKMMKEV